MTPRPPRVLIVDDEPSIRRALELMLEDTEAVHAGSVAEAREKLASEHAIDLALVDKNLPDGSGLELISDMHERWPGAPTLIMTAYPTLESAIEAVEGGAFDYVVKPFDRRDLLHKVEKAVEKSRLESRLRHAERMEIVGQLASTLAHDLNNTLTIFTTYSSFVREFLEANAQRLDVSEPLEDIGAIEHACESARSLTRQLLTLGSRQVVSPEVISLDDVVRELVPTMRRSVGRRIELRVELGDAVPRVRADVGQCEQVILNLVLNARDAIEGDGVIEVSTRRLETREPVAQLLVRDDGAGMDAPTAASIFEPFFTTKGAGRGTGLGLASVRRIAESLGGRVTVASELGAGACFTVELPGVSDAEAARRVSSRPSLPAVPGETILLAERNDAVRESGRRILERAGYVVECVEDGGDVEAALERSAPDIVVLDVELPGPRTSAIVERLRARVPGARLLLLAGGAVETVTERAFAVEESSFPFVAKPFSENSLLKAVRRAAALTRAG